jgi:hypothetical protein
MTSPTVHEDLANGSQLNPIHSIPRSLTTRQLHRRGTANRVILNAHPIRPRTKRGHSVCAQQLAALPEATCRARALRDLFVNLFVTLLSIITGTGSGHNCVLLFCTKSPRRATRCSRPCQHGHYTRLYGATAEPVGTPRGLQPGTAPLTWESSPKAY